MFVNQKGPPFYIFRHCTTFSERKNFSKIPSFFPKTMFCAFWALDIALTLDVLVLFVRPQTSSCMCHFLQKLLKLLRPSPANAILVQRVPPFIFYLFYVTYKTGRDQCVPPFNFFRHCANIFWKIFFDFSKESLPVFWYFATECMLINPKGSPLFIFRHSATFFERKKYEVFFKKSFFCSQSAKKVIRQSHRAWKAHFGCLETVFKAFHEYVLGIFKKTLRFLSLRYSADFRRSRLVLISSRCDQIKEVSDATKFLFSLFK